MRQEQLSRGFYLICKGAFDVVVSALAIFAFFLPCLVLSVLVAIDTKQFPIYREKRMARGGGEFGMLKFRTMVADADDVEKYLDEEQLTQWFLHQEVDFDPRVTTLGKQLRASGIDDFPQFLNILVGQMSFFGPSAVTRDELITWYKPAEQEELLSVRPGMTGPWQSGAFGQFSYLDGTRQKLELTCARNAGFALDMKLYQDALNYPLTTPRES